jgi:chromosome segregation ATPase
MLRYLTLTVSLAVWLGLSTGAASRPARHASRAKAPRTASCRHDPLRTAEAERATLQATQAQSAEENKELTEKVEKLTKQAASTQEESEKTIAGLNARIEGKDAEIVQFRESLEKWKKAQAEAADLARKKEGERAALAQQKIVLDRIVADQRTKNAAMYKIGKEILARYEGFGLGTALTAREPFIGTMRVKLENLVQDYGDKLADERIKTAPTGDASRETKPSAEPTTSTTRKTRS